MGSTTSGVDGSSEGGRIDTMRVPDAIVLHAIPLIQSLVKGGYKGRLTAEAAMDAKGWKLKLIYHGDEPPEAPALWYGRRVVIAKGD